MGRFSAELCENEQCTILEFHLAFFESILWPIFMVRFLTNICFVCELQNCKFSSYFWGFVYILFLNIWKINTIIQATEHVVESQKALLNHNYCSFTVLSYLSYLVEQMKTVFIELHFDIPDLQGEKFGWISYLTQKCKISLKAYAFQMTLKRPSVIQVMKIRWLTHCIFEYGVLASFLIFHIWCYLS